MADLLRAVGSLLSGVASLAWPAFAIVAILVLRPHLPGLIAGLKSIRMGPFAADLWQREERVVAAIVRASAPADADDLVDLANTSPHVAVRTAFDQLLGDLREIAEQAGVQPSSDPVELARALVDRGVIDPGTPEQVDTLRDLVALATYDPGRLDSAEALRIVTYAQVARNVLRRSRTQPPD